MPKRLLRYALSRLDFLDDDALDTDNLDLALGRNTVLEFRDVGIKLKVWPTLLSHGCQRLLDKVLMPTTETGTYTQPTSVVQDP